MRTQSTGVPSAGLVMIFGFAVINPWGVSTCRSSKGVRAQTVTSMDGSWASQAATVPPMAPGPMRAMVVMGNSGGNEAAR